MVTACAAGRSARAPTAAPAAGTSWIATLRMAETIGDGSGAVLLSSAGRLDRVERGEDGLDLEPAAGDELTAGATERDRDGRRPAVLPHQQGSRGAGREGLGGLLHVV